MGEGQLGSGSFQCRIGDLVEAVNEWGVKRMGSELEIE